jgi:peptidoglycan-N-acetylglucosamine deacetylase
LRSPSVILSVVMLVGLTPLASAAECPGHPDAIGTSRNLVVDPREHPRIGSMQYSDTLPLEDHEVVLSFDDGPLSPYTNRVLDTLTSQCVKATFFIIGRMANGEPQLVRRAFDEGHSVGTHTQNHLLHLSRLPLEAQMKEVDDGIASVTAALGDTRPIAPFFRFPGLAHPPAVEAELASRGIMVWSADADADDWKKISPQEVVRRALTRLEHKGKGVLLLHDMQRRTAIALPDLLRALHSKGFRIVHVVPANASSPAATAAHAP